MHQGGTQAVAAALAKFASITPRTHLLIDAIGALVTAIVLGFFAYRSDVSGAPAYHVTVLAIYALALFGYDVYVLTQRGTNLLLHLRRIAKANLLYVGLMGVVLLRFWGGMAGWTKAYFVAEVVVLLLLVRTEFKAVQGAEAPGH